MKINRSIEYTEVEKRLKENFSVDTDYDTFHKINGKIVIHFWDKEYLKNQKQKASNKCQSIK